MKKRIISFLLAFVMLIGIMPLDLLVPTAHAAETVPDDDGAGWVWNSDKSVLYIKNGIMSSGSFYNALKEKFGEAPSSGGTIVKWGGDYRYDISDHDGFEWRSETEVTSTSTVTPNEQAAYAARRTGSSSYSSSINFTVKYYYVPTITEDGDLSGATVPSTVISGNAITVTLPKASENGWVAKVSTSGDVPAQTVKLSPDGTTVVTLENINSTEDAIIKVEYSKATSYNISVKVAGETPWGGASASATSSIAGETITIMATPKDNTSDATYAFSKLTVNGVEQTDKSFTMPEGNVEVVVYFTKTDIHFGDDKNTTIEFNGWYQDATKLSAEQLAALKEEILTKLDIEFLPSKDDWANVTIQFYPRYEAKNTDGALWSDDEIVDILLDQKLYDLNASIGELSIRSLGYDGKNFGERAYNSGAELKEITERVRISYNGLYVETSITLTEARPQAVIGDATIGTEGSPIIVTTETTDDILSAIKNNVNVTVNGAAINDSLAGWAITGDVPAPGCLDPVELTVKITVASTQDYTAAVDKEISVYVKLDTYTITWYDEDGTSVLYILNNVPYGAEVPAYAGVTPTKQNDGSTKYTHSGWNLTTGTVGEGNSVIGEMVYVATYSSEDIYAVSFNDGTTVVKTFNINATQGQTLTAEGKTITLKDKNGATLDSYTLPDARDNNKLFKNWDKVVASTYTEDTTYVATWYADGNNNDVKDEDETITINLAGNATITIDGTAVSNGQSYVYDSTKQNTVVITPADLDGSNASADYVKECSLTGGSFSNGVYTWTGKLTDGSTLSVEIGTATLTNKGEILWLNGYSKDTKFNNLKNNIISAVLGGGITTEYNVHVWIDNPVGNEWTGTEPRYFNLDDKGDGFGTVAADWTQLTVYNADRFTVPAYGSTGSLKVKIIKYASGDGKIVQLTLADAVIPTKESRKPAKVSFSSAVSGKYDTLEAFNSAITDTINVLDNNNADCKENAGLTVTLTPVEGRANTYTVSYSLANDGETWLKTSGTLPGEVVWNISFYKVIFVNDNGDVLSEVEYPYGTTADKIVLPNATKADKVDEFGNVMATYTFAGWDPSVDTVTKTVTYTATYKEVAKTYTITWVNGDKTTTETYEYGATPVAPEASKSDKKDDAGNLMATYKDGTWGTIATVTGDATYTATFTEDPATYTVTFKNYNGDVIETETLEYGESIVSPANPTRGDDVDANGIVMATYEFKDWGATVAATVTGNVTYTATYTKTVAKYTVTWSNNGTTISAEYAYGTELPAPENPTAPDGYGFECWESGGKCIVFPYTVQKDVTFTAKFVEAVAKIGDTYYTTWDAAYDAAQAGDKIVLLMDVTAAGELRIEKSVTVDGNGFKFASESGNSDFAVVLAADGVTLVNVTVEGDITVDGAKVTFATKVKANKIVGDGTGYGIVAEQGTVIEANVEFKGTCDYANTDMSGAKHTDNTSYWTFKNFDSNGVSVGYANDLSGLSNGYSVQLLENATIENDLTLVGEGLVGVLNLNGHTLSIASGKAIIVNGTLTVKDEGVARSAGKIDGTILLNHRDATVIGPQGLDVQMSSDLETKGYKLSVANGTYSLELPLPTVAITDIKNTLTENDPNLTFALNFAITGEYSKAYLDELFAVYGDWYTDYVLTISGLADPNVTFNANGADGYLAGQYDAWSQNWVSVPFDDVTVNNGQSLYIMEYAAKLMNKEGLRFTLAEIAQIVQNFDCGVYFTPEFLEANPDLEVSLQLKVFTEDASGNKTGNIDVATNEFENNAVAIVVPVKGQDTYFDSLAAAIAAAGEGDKVLLIQDAELTGTVTVNYNIEIDPNGKKITGSGTVKLGADVALTAPAGLTVESGVAKKTVVFENGVYKLVADENENGVDDTLETGTVTVNKVGNGNVTLTPAGKATLIKQEGNVYTYLWDSNDAANKVINVSTSLIDTNYNDGNGDYVISAPAAVNVGETLTVKFGTVSMTASNGTVKINKYYTGKSDKNALATLRTDILKAAGLDPNGNYVVTAVVGIQSLKITATVVIENGKATVTGGIANGWDASGVLANELNKGSYSFVITLPASGNVPEVSKSVTMQMEDSRSSAGLVDTEITDVKVLNDQQGLTDYVNSLANGSVVNPNGVTVTVTLAEGSWPPAAAGVTTKLVYTIEYADSADYIGDEAKLTVYVQSHYSNCTVVPDATLTAGGSLTVSPSGDNTTVAGNDTVTITVSPSGNNVVETITVYKNGEVFATYTTNNISYNNKKGTVSFKSDGSAGADVYTVKVEYSQSYLNLKADQTIVYCVDDKDHTYDLQKMVFDAIFGGSCAPMAMDNVTLEFKSGSTDLLGWATLDKAAILTGHKFGESGSETIRLKYSDDKYGSFEQQVVLNVFDSCYNVTVGVETVTNGANATIKTQFSYDARKYLGVNYYKQGASLTVTLTPDGEILNTLATMYNGTYAESMAYIKGVTVYDKNGNPVASTLVRGKSKLDLSNVDGLGDIWNEIQNLKNLNMYNASVTFDLAADEQYKIVVEYGIHKLEKKNDGFEMDMHKGGKDYSAVAPSAEELIHAILGEDEAAAFLATYGGAFTVQYTTATLQNEWTDVTDEALLALNDGTTIKVRITWKGAEDNNTYYPVAVTADVTLVDKRTATSVQGTVPTVPVEYVEESQLIENLKNAMGLGILANSTLIDVAYEVNYTIEVLENGNFATVKVTYHGSADYKPTTKTFENVPIADIPDNATVKVTIQNATDLISNNAGTIMDIDTITGIYTVIGNGTYNFKFKPVTGYAINSVTVNGVSIPLTYNRGEASFSMLLSEKAHYEIRVETVSSAFELEKDRIYNFAYGVMTPVNGDIVDAVIKYPSADTVDYSKVVIEYLAREQGTVTITLPDLELLGQTIELGTFDVELGELWLDPTTPASDDELEKTLDKLIADLIEEVTANPTEITKAVEYIKEKLQLTNIGAHAFGSNGDASIETVRIRYADDKYVIGEVVTDVTIHDSRIATEIIASDCQVTYGYSLEQLIAASGAGVYVDGSLVSGLTIETNGLFKHAGDHEITLYFAGNEEYQPSKLTINVNIKKAITSIDYDSQFITYGDKYDFTLSISPERMPDGSISDPELIEFMIGLDMEKLLDFSANQDIVGLNKMVAKIHIRLPQSIRDVLESKFAQDLGISDMIQEELSLGELSDLLESLSGLPNFDSSSVDTLNQVIEAITGFTDKVDITVSLKYEDFHPTNVGIYIAGAVTIDSDYETAYTADYLIIAPKTNEVQLGWNENKALENYIVTLPVWNSMDKGASILGDPVEDFDIKYLILGINSDSSEFLTTDIYGNIKANIWLDPADIQNNGAYVQIAYGVLWGNETSYAVPIVRAFTIVPGTVNVELVGQNGTPNRELLKEFNNQPQGFSVKVYDSNGVLIYSDHYQQIVAAPENARVTVYYVGVQSNGQFYHSTEKPVHAGVYTAIAVYADYRDADQGLTVMDVEDIINNVIDGVDTSDFNVEEIVNTIIDDLNGLESIGMDTGVIVITPTESTVEVKDSLDNVVNGSISHKPIDMVTAGSTVEGLTPDTTVISVGIGSNGSFSENGWDAIIGTVNVDFPNWVDAILEKYAPSIIDGIEVGTLADKLLGKLPEIVAALEAEGATNDVLDALKGAIENVIDMLEKMPEDAVVSFADDIAYVNVGVYAVVAIVTDSDHYPSMDAGLLVIRPEVHQVELKWNYEDSNFIWTRELLKYFNWNASAYENGILSQTATALIKNQFITIAPTGDLTIYTNPENMPNGAYVNVAYIPLELDGVMYVSNLIARPMLLVPTNAVVEFVDENGNVNKDRHFIFNNAEQGMAVKVTVNGTVITPEAGDLRVFYYGVQTNGKTYEGETDPVHAGAYTVLAIYTDYDSDGNLVAIGASVGVMAIEPAESDITVGDVIIKHEDKTATSHNIADVLDIHASSAVSGLTPDVTVIVGSISTKGDFSENGWSAIGGQINVDFPDWVDAILEEYVPGIYSGLTVAEFSDKVLAHLPEIKETLTAAGVSATVSDALNAAMEEIATILAKLSSDVVLTFAETETLTAQGIGLYVVIGVVTDSDHYPSSDAGILALIPDVDQVFLKWNYEDTNGIFTHELLQNVELLKATAYDDKNYEHLYDDKAYVITYQFVGIGADGNLVVISNPAELKNGAYVELAYIEFEVAGEMVISDVIARPIIVTPNIIDVDIKDANNNGILYREFTNKPHVLEVELSYQGTAVVPNYENLTVTYVGIQSNGKTYNSSAAPTHAGTYVVTAVYIHRDANGQVLAVGLDVATLVIAPAKSHINVDNSIIKYEDKNSTNVTIADELGIHAGSKADEDLVVDTTVIVGSIASSGDFSEDGWAAITETVNVDFPRWVDDLLIQYAPEVYDGMTVAAFKAKMISVLAEIEEAISSVEIESEVLTSLEEAMKEISAIIELLPASVTVTFESMDTYTTHGIGAYAVIGIVTDSDHYPSVDAGILVITPDVDVVHLDWDYKDCNGIWTRELLKIAGITNATAYDDIFHTVPYTDKKVEITYQFIGVNVDGELTVYDRAEDLANGLYTQVAYVKLEIAGEMVLSDIIARPILVTANTADVDLVGRDNVDILVREFNNAAQVVEGVIFGANGNVITPDANDIWTIRYIGMMTNGKAYNSTEAPVHAGVYTVIAAYVGYDDNGNLNYVGMEVGILLVKPTTSSITVEGGKVTYDGNAHSATVDVTSKVEGLIPDTVIISGTAYPTISGSVNEVGIDALYGNVNIDLPAWIDAILREEIEAYAGGVDAEYLADLVDTYRNKLIALIPADQLAALGADQEKIDEIIAYFNAPIDALLEVLEALPVNVSLTFEDNKTYTEPGTYLYYAFVADSDHVPTIQATTARAGVLTIEKKDSTFGAWHEVIPYDGKEHTVFVPNDVYGPVKYDYVTMILDRKNNHINFILDEDLAYIMDKVEVLLGIEIPEEITVESLNARLAKGGLTIDDFADAIVYVLDAVLAKMDIPTDPEEYAHSTYRDLDVIRTLLSQLPKDGTITVNGKLPVNAGAYEFYLYGYSQYYDSVDASAVLFIEPIRVVINDVATGKVYGESDPALEATVKYYSIVGREDPYTWEGKTDGLYGQGYVGYDDGNFARIVYERIEIDPENLPEGFEMNYVITRGEGEDVGLYDIAVDATVSDTDNYILEIVEDGDDFEITPAPLTITLDNQGKIYGTVDSELTYTVDGLVNGDVIADLNIVPSREPGEAKGQYKITATTSNPNYDITVVDAIFTIANAIVTVNVEDATKVYGEADPELKFTYTVEGTVSESELGLSVERVTGENAGEYAINAIYNASENYAVVVNNGILTITPASVTIIVADASKTYGDAESALSYEWSVVSGNVTAAELGITVNRVAGENAGQYAINADWIESDNYVVTANTATFTIHKKAITVTAENATKVYGDADPQFTAVVETLVGNDHLEITFSREENQNVGTYTITPAVTADSVTLGNYDITCVPGTLTVTKATATVKVDNVTKVYGEDDPTFTATVDGLKYNDRLTITYSRDNGNDVGNYTVTASASNDNYNILFESGTLTITKASVTVTLENKTKVYGAADPVLSYTVIGLVNGDTEEALNIQASRVDGVDAGTYVISASASNANYDITVVDGTLTITPASLTITVDDQSKVYGDADPTFTFKVEGLVNGDGVEDLNISVSRDPGNDTGTYAIKAIASNRNYDITYVNGTLTIAAGKVVITIDDQTKVYGTNDPVFTYSQDISGTVNEEQLNVVIERAGGEDVGEYEITARYTASTNYVVEVVPGTLTVTPASVTITVGHVSKTYGQQDPTFTYVVTGLVGNDDASMLNVQPIRATGESVGVYAITALASHKNYTITVVLGSLTITEASICLGDVNSDGYIDSVDVILLRLFIMDSLDASVAFDRNAADVSGDGVHDLRDVVWIRRYIIGDITQFPAEN